MKDSLVDLRSSFINIAFFYMYFFVMYSTFEYLCSSTLTQKQKNREPLGTHWTVLPQFLEKDSFPKKLDSPLFSFITILSHFRKKLIKRFRLKASQTEL